MPRVYMLRMSSYTHSHPQNAHTHTRTHFVINVTKELKNFFYTKLKRLMKTLEKGKVVHA